MRSNRQLTQFAVDKLRGYLMTGIAGVTAAGNTEVECEECHCCDERPAHVVVRLFGREIFRAYTSPLNGRTVVGIQVKTGDFYDSKGRPSRTTRERLNGLLDWTCSNSFLPEGVRVFLREDGHCCIGKGDACKVLDQSNPAVVIMAHPTDLILA